MIFHSGVDLYEKRSNINVRNHYYFIRRQEDGIVDIPVVMFKNAKSIMAITMVSQIESYSEIIIVNY